MIRHCTIFSATCGALCNDGRLGDREIPETSVGKPSIAGARQSVVPSRACRPLDATLRLAAASASQLRPRPQSVSLLNKSGGRKVCLQAVRQSMITHNTMAKNAEAQQQDR